MRARTVAVTVLSTAAFAVGLSLGPPARRVIERPEVPGAPVPRATPLEEAWRALEASDPPRALRSLTTLGPDLSPAAAAERDLLVAWAGGEDLSLSAVVREHPRTPAAAAAERLLVIRARDAETRRARGDAFAAHWPASWWAGAARRP